MAAHNILITGLPGVGKTTVLIKLLKELEDLDTAGFYTREIRRGGRREGFELLCLDGEKRILAHVDIRSPRRVGRYGVDVEGFEAILESLDLLHSPSPIVLIDEIGKMECYSTKFTALMENLFDSGKTVVATIAARGAGFIDVVKRRKDCETIVVSTENRNDIPAALARKIRRIAEHIPPDLV